MNPGDIVVVRFPFVSLESSKKRPAVLLLETSHGSRIQLRTLAMVTSKIEGLRLDGDVAIKDWKGAGLLHPSLVRLSKIATVDGDLVERRIGRLDQRDASLVKREFRRLFRHWV